MNKINWVFCFSTCVAALPARSSSQPSRESPIELYRAQIAASTDPNYLRQEHSRVESSLAFYRAQLRQVDYDDAQARDAERTTLENKLWELREEKSIVEERILQVE